MSENSAIGLRGVGKSYQRFTSPVWQAVSLLGCPVPARRYDVFWALEDISFDVCPGERIGLIGRNGAGKSTLLRIIARQLAPTCGAVRVNGAVQALMELGYWLPSRVKCVAKHQDRFSLERIWRA